MARRHARRAAQSSAAQRRRNRIQDRSLRRERHSFGPSGGVSASFAMLGDIIIAEKGSMIGFAGKRVIEKTINEQLPEDFQTAEYLLEHGMIDIVVHRKELRETLSKVLSFLKK